MSMSNLCKICILKSTHDRFIASKMSCASFVTPLPRVASFSLTFFNPAASRVWSAFRSMRAMAGRRFSKAMEAEFVGDLDGVEAGESSAKVWMREIGIIL